MPSTESEFDCEIKPNVDEITYCRLLVPTFNERHRVERCLTSVFQASLPKACVWREWAVLDDASSDGTPEVAETWAKAHPEIRMRVVRKPHRSGKASSIDTYFSEVRHQEWLDDIIVQVDADVVVQRDAISALLNAFLSDLLLGVAWGADEADDRTFGRWASTFQLEAVNRQLAISPINTPRAYTRFLAYRPRMLADFRWDTGAIRDDDSIANFVRERRVRTTNVLNARVTATPAAGYEDFYRQTYRAYAQRGRLALMSRKRARAATAVALQHPFWAGAYLVARVICAIRHRLFPANFSHLWAPSLSTKGPPRPQQDDPS